jgi:hypothetical protein
MLECVVAEVELQVGKGEGRVDDPVESVVYELAASSENDQGEMGEVRKTVADGFG